MVVSINEKAYSMTDRLFSRMLSIAKETFTKTNQNAIYCIMKNGRAEMRNDIFESHNLLKKTIKEYKDRGFKVYFTKSK